MDRLKIAREILTRADSYSRLPTLIELWIDGRLTRKQFLRLLGEQWPIADNVSSNLAGLSHTPFMEQLTGVVPEMMTKEERQCLESLPETLTIYRGCYANNEEGLSWTLSKDVAAKFPTFGRYRGEGRPRLITAAVPKNMIRAIKLDRGESEIITFLWDVISVELLDQPKPLDRRLQAWVASWHAQAVGIATH